MNSSVRMLVVLAGISLVSGTSLGALHRATYELAENNILRFKKIPAVVTITETLRGALAPEERVALEEELLAEKRLVDVGAAEPLLAFVVTKDGAPYAVAFEDYGQGFGGKLGVMVGFELASDRLLGIGVTTMSETPGVGTRVREPAFAKQFEELSLATVFKVKKDGGELDSLSGATISSRAVAAAVEAALAMWREHGAAIREAVATPPPGPGGVA